MELSDHRQNGFCCQGQQRSATPVHAGENRSADQIGKSQVSQISRDKIARQGKNSTSSRKYERHVVSCYFSGGHASINSMLSSLTGKELPIKKRKLHYQLQIEEEVADSDDPTVDLKLLMPEFYNIYALGANGEVICQMTPTLGCIPDCQSETSDLNCKRVHPYEITPKPAVAWPDGRPRCETQRNPKSNGKEEPPECKAGNKHTNKMVNGVKGKSSTVYNSENCRRARSRKAKNSY